MGAASGRVDCRWSFLVLVAAAAAAAPVELRVRADAPNLPVVDLTVATDAPLPVVARALEGVRAVLLADPALENDAGLRARIAGLPSNLEGWRSGLVEASLEVGPPMPEDQRRPSPDGWPQGPGTGAWISATVETLGPWHVVRLEWSDGTTDRWSAQVLDGQGEPVPLTAMVEAPVPEADLWWPSREGLVVQRGLAHRLGGVDPGDTSRATTPWSEVSLTAAARAAVDALEPAGTPGRTWTLGGLLGPADPVPLLGGPAEESWIGACRALGAECPDEATSRRVVEDDLLRRARG